MNVRAGHETASPIAIAKAAADGPLDVKTPAATATATINRTDG